MTLIDAGKGTRARKPLSERSWKCMVSTDTMLAGYPISITMETRKLPEHFWKHAERGRMMTIEKIIDSIEPIDRKGDGRSRKTLEFHCQAPPQFGKAGRRYYKDCRHDEQWQTYVWIKRR